MKKSILMAIVALALLAAPAFAGDYAIVGNIDWGFGTALGGTEDLNDVAGTESKVVNDFTMLGFFGSIDANNSIGIVMEYGASGDGSHIDGNLPVTVTEFTLNTNVLGAFGLTDLPVTFGITAGHGRLNLHNRFQQWTGWEVKRWKDYGAAHFAGSYSATDPGAWSRPNFLKFNLGIMNMVNLTFAMVPNFAVTGANSEGDAVSDIPMMIDIWTSGITVGPAALDIAANLRMDGGEVLGVNIQQIRAGAQVTANMNFGALALMAFVGEDYATSIDPNAEGFDNMIVVAVKPSYNFGAGSAALGAWMTLNTIDDGTDSFNYIDLAIDLSASFSTFTIYGGVLISDLSDENENEETPMKLDVGVKNSFGGATIGLGVTTMLGTEDGSGSTIDNNDIGAVDGTGMNWLDADNNAMATLYFRVTAWY